MSNSPLTLRDLDEIGLDRINEAKEKKKAALENFGIQSVLDLLETYPRRYIDRTNMITIADSIGTWDKLWTAIGYLSTWNLSYPTVNIFRDGGDDLVAVYRNDAGEKTYVIGAVWHGEHYGFHS